MLMHILIYILVGVVAGFLAGLIMRGGGFGFIVNLIVGIIGGFLGGWLMSLVGIEKSGLLWEIVTAVVGAVVFLFILSLFSRRK